MPRPTMTGRAVLAAAVGAALIAVALVIALVPGSDKPGPRGPAGPTPRPGSTVVRTSVSPSLHVVTAPPLVERTATRVVTVPGPVRTVTVTRTPAPQVRTVTVHPAPRTVTQTVTRTCLPLLC